MITRIVLFLIINFAGLAIGGLFTGKGVSSEWYTNLAQAPWTPPGWVFGAAWTTIMICLALFMAYWWPMKSERRPLIGLFTTQWVLNFAWNPVFFHYQQVLAGLVIISLLTLLVGAMMLYSWQDLKTKGLLLLPYFIWLCIATSLNTYIFLKN